MKKALLTAILCVACASAGALTIRGSISCGVWTKDRQGPTSQEAVYINREHGITDKVIKALNASR